MHLFSDSRAIAYYADGPARQVPGFHAMQQMAALLLAERVPVDGRVLVLGAGGGLELKLFSEFQPGWRLLGVDPSAPMLELARTLCGGNAHGVELRMGVVDDVEAHDFDGATCLLTLHFLDPADRLHTLQQLHCRLKPGAPLVVAHHSFPAGEDGRRWLHRYAAFAAASGIPRADAERAIEAISMRLPVLSPEQDVELVHAAGFGSVELFYAGFSFRGWVATA